MKIVLTGITGFIGSHLAERLVSENNEVHAIVRTTSKIDELSDTLRKNVKFHIYNRYHDIAGIINNINDTQGGGKFSISFGCACNVR